jgi:RHS repeat-associated protein
MYQPTLGRFLSRDPLSANGVDVLTDTGFYAERLAAMRANPWYYGGNWEPPYVYARNNPVTWIDPSGLICQIGIHCYAASSDSSGSGGVGRHCGLTVTDDTHTFWIDGEWKNGLRIRCDKHPRPEDNPTEYPQSPFPNSVCACLQNYCATFNNARVPYWATCGNSNWALRCITKHCAINVTWGSSGAPLGWNCEECSRYTCDWWGERICVEMAPKKCPGDPGFGKEIPGQYCGHCGIRKFD